MYFFAGCNSSGAIFARINPTPRPVNEKAKESIKDIFILKLPVLGLLQIDPNFPL